MRYRMAHLVPCGGASFFRVENGHFRPTGHEGSNQKWPYLADKPLWQRENGHIWPTNDFGSEKMVIFGRQTTLAARKWSFSADKPLWRRENGHFRPTNYFGNVKMVIFAPTNYFGGMKMVIFAPPPPTPGTAKEIFPTNAGFGKG